MGLGKIRADDPIGVEFVLRHMIHRSKVQEKARKDAERKAKSRSHKIR